MIFDQSLYKPGSDPVEIKLKYCKVWINSLLLGDLLNFFFVMKHKPNDLGVAKRGVVACAHVSLVCTVLNMSTVMEKVGREEDAAKNEENKALNSTNDNKKEV